MSDERDHNGAARAGEQDGSGKPVKRPRAKKPGKSKAASKSKAAAAKSKAVDSKSKADTPPSAAKPAKLGAYGLATDVLRSSDGETGSGDEETGAFDVRISDPERIFSFADRLAARGETEVEPETPKRITTWVTFHLAGEVFALPVEPVREVLRVTSITRVPHAPAPIRGVSNVRGRVIPVIDLRLRIGLEAADLDRSSRIVVVRSRGRLLGLLVDAVHQVVHIDLNQAQPPPEDVMTLQSDYISGVYHLQEQLVLLLDVERALLLRDAGEGEAGPGPTAAATVTGGDPGSSSKGAV